MKRAVGLRPQPNKNTQLAQPLNWGVKSVSAQTASTHTLSLFISSSLLSFFPGSVSAVVSNES